MNILDGLNLGLGIAALSAGCLDLLVVMKRDLMMLQQNSYRSERYCRWFEEQGESTNLGRIFACIGLFFMLIGRLPLFVGAAISTAVVIWQGLWLLTRRYKKPLVWTRRAKRIYGVMLLLAAAAIGVSGGICGVHVCACVAVGSIVLSPLYLLVANWLLIPVEKKINDRYLHEAEAILAGMPDLKVIGITGSYGKTSTKHYLERILEEKYSVCMTPGSYNTPMGVIRTIREKLKPYDEVFIAEMGAKQRGDIKEICDIVHPQIGIITAVGEQHLESFKTIENVQRTKFELADALPHGGMVVVNNDFPQIAKREVNNVECVRYALTNTGNADFKAYDISYSPEGTDFTLSGKTMEEPLRLHTRLVGECNISNLVAAVIVALHLGVDREGIKRAVADIEQVEHRLNLKRTPGNVLIIDDAFNSNPHGAKMALEVLSMMKQGRRILVTPGMIELGTRQEEANREFGRQAAQRCDIAIVVGRYNREAIGQGLYEMIDQHKANTLREEDIHAVTSFAEAQQLLKTILRPGDVVLYENDLPDTFK